MKTKLGALLVATFLSSCTTVDRNAAATLGTAGENATQALSSQAAQASETLGDLNQWWGIHDELVCINAPNADARVACIKGASAPAPDPSVTQIIDLLAKHKQAIDTLNQAYAAFVDLAHYNAGQAATAALNTAFANVNSFTGAVSALPGATAIAPISTTVEKATAGALSIIADNEENAQILAANTDLETANDALYKGLQTESTAMTSLLVTLQAEREALYQSGFDAEIISPTDVLTPVFSEAYPGIHLQAAPAANRDVIAAAAKNVISIENQITNTAVSKSYTDALATLQAVSAQHKKLAAAQPLNLDQIEGDISSLQTNMAQVSSASTAKK